MANRKISEFPTLASQEIVDADLLTLVHVFEADPALRNKKITFSGFRDYLDDYYVAEGQSIISGNTITANNVYVTQTITGDTISVISGNFTSVTGNSGQFTTISGSSVTLDIINNTTIRTTRINTDSGVFGSGTGSNPSITFEGQDDLGIFVGSSSFNNNPALGFTTNGSERFRISEEGSFGIAGENYGTHGQILVSQGSGQTPTWSSTISGIIISGGEVTITGNLFVSDTITGNTISGKFINAVNEITAASGAFTNTVTGATFVADTISGLTTISGQTITGITGQFTTGVFQDLSSETFTANSNSNISGNLYVGSNLNVSGNSTVSGNLNVNSNSTISGNLNVSGNLDISGIVISSSTDGLTVTSGIIVSGNISGTTVTGQTATFTTGEFNNLYVNDSIIVTSGLTVTGDLNVSGEAYFESGLTARDPIFISSGTEDAPSLAFIDDADTGLYSSSGNTLDFATSGTRRVTISSGTNGAILTIWGS